MKTEKMKIHQVAHCPCGRERGRGANTNVVELTTGELLNDRSKTAFIPPQAIHGIISSYKSVTSLINAFYSATGIDWHKRARH